MPFVYVHPHVCVSGVAVGSPLGPLLANVFLSSIEDTLERQGELPSSYRRYTDDTLTVMPDLATAATFLHTLDSAHTSVKNTMEVECKLLFLGTELLNHAPRIETKVYVKPTNKGRRYPCNTSGFRRQCYSSPQGTHLPFYTFSGFRSLSPSYAVLVQCGIFCFEL